jgi:tetratricopeptide (TPR) repeat protein
MRRLLLLSASVACLSGCTCGKSPPSPSTIDAGMALSQPPPPPVPERAMQLHMEGRRHGEAGAFAQALQSFQQARELAPHWPLPLYDVGLTYLYMKDEARALEAYEQLAALAPQGVSDSQRMLDSLRREKDGRVPAGTLREFLEVMQLKDLPELQRRLEALTKKAPAFVPAWDELARFASEQPQEAERLLAQALALEPDPGTRAGLLVYKATLLRRKGESAAARKLLEAVRDDASTPPSTAAEARELLSIPDNVVP